MKHEITLPVSTLFRGRFSSTLRGAHLARVSAATRLAAWGRPRGSEAGDTAVLLVAELSANAVRHGTLSGRDFELCLVLDPGKDILRIEVSDVRGEKVPVLPDTDGPGPGADAESGRGLLLVDALAARWGWTFRPPSGKTVWAEIESGPGA